MAVMAAAQADERLGAPVFFHHDATLDLSPKLVTNPVLVLVVLRVYKKEARRPSTQSLVLSVKPS